MLYTNREIAIVLQLSGLLDVVPNAVMGEVMERYADDLRYYHDFDHIAETLSWINRALEDIPEQDLAPYTSVELRLATLFHDIVYGSDGSPANEQRSCHVYRELVGDMPDDGRSCVRVDHVHGRARQARGG